MKEALYCVACGRKLIKDVRPLLEAKLVCICCMKAPDLCDCTPRDDHGGRCTTYHSFPMAAGT